MSKLRSLSLKGLDLLNQIRQLHNLLEIALEQEKFSEDGNQTRTGLLVHTYLLMVEPELDDLVLTLEEIRQCIQNTMQPREEKQ